MSEFLSHESKITLHYKVDKGWQTKDFEFILGLKKDRQKFWMLIFTNTKGEFRIKFLNQKPEIIPWQGNFIQIWRKYFPSGILAGIYLIEKHYCLLFYSGSDKIVLVLNKDHEYELFYCSKEDKKWYSLIRWGKQSIYTIKKEVKDNLVVKTITEIEEKKCEDNLLPWDLDQHIKTQSEIVLDEGTSVEHILKPGLNTLEDKSNTLVQDLTEEKSKHQKQLLSSLKRRKKTLLKSYNKIKTQTVSEEELDKIKSEAFYLKENFYSIQDQDGESFQGKDIDKVFKKYKKATRNFQMMNQRLAMCKQDIDSLEADILRLSSKTVEEQELSDIENKYHIVKKVTSYKKMTDAGGGGIKNEKASVYRTFEVAREMIYVGKDAKNNDILTKGLKSNDYWFHAVGGTGSHVAVKNKGSELDSKIIRASCILALFFSGSHPRSGSVYFCQRMNLKNTPTVGLWKVLRSKVIDLSYTDEELNDILSGEIR